MSKEPNSNPFNSPGQSQPDLATKKAEARLKKAADARTQKIIRVLIGVIAGLMLLVGVYFYQFRPDTDPLITGILIRVGSLLAVICLAFPELMSLRGRMSAVMYGLALILIVLIAVRPKMSRVLISLAVIGVGVGWVMKWMTKITNQDPRRR